MKTKHKSCVAAAAAAAAAAGAGEKMKSVILYPYGPLTGTGCCRMLHAKNLALTSAIYTINISLLIVLIYSWRINVNIRRSGELEDVYYGVQVAYFAIIGTQMSMIVLSIMLIFGIYKENPGLIVPWIIGYITFMALEAVATVYSNVLRDHVNKQFDAMCKAEVAFFIARAFINVLAMWGVLRFYNLVRAGITWNGPEAKTALTSTAYHFQGGRSGGGGGPGGEYRRGKRRAAAAALRDERHRKPTGCCFFDLDFDDYDEDVDDDDEGYAYDDYYDEYDEDDGDGEGDYAHDDDDIEEEEDGDSSDCAMLGAGSSSSGGHGSGNGNSTGAANVGVNGGIGGGGGLRRPMRQQRQRLQHAHCPRNNNIRTVLMHKRHLRYKIAQPQTRLEVINESERSAGSGSDENDSLLVAYDSTSSLASV